MIRLFTFEDEEACRTIVDRCFHQCVVLGQSEKEFLRKYYIQPGYFQSVSKKHNLFIFEKQGIVLALGGIEGNEIKKLYVEPANHGVGIGSAMLGYLEQIGITNGNSELVLYCFDNSIDFYMRRGYSRTGQHVFERENIRIPTTKMVKNI